MRNSISEVFRKAVLYLGRRGLLNWVNDESYLKILFKLYFGYDLDLNSPRSYNEKLQWLKINDRDSRLVKFVDKLEVREIVKEKVGEEHLIPLIWSGSDVDFLSLADLPDRFVMKCTHDSGSVQVCRDKSSFDFEKAKEFIRERQRRNLYWAGREWAYKDVLPRIVVEEYIGTDKDLPEDYKFFVFDGRIDCVMVCKDRASGHPDFYYYDMNWKRLPYMKEEPEGEAERPGNFGEMVSLASSLAEGFSTVRIDLYSIGDKVYFGEYTFFSQMGFDVDITEEADIRWGSMIEEVSPGSRTWRILKSNATINGGN